MYNTFTYKNCGQMKFIQGQFRLFIKCLLMTLSAPTSVMNADQDNRENLCISDKDSIARMQRRMRMSLPSIKRQTDCGRV